MSKTRNSALGIGIVGFGFMGKRHYQSYQACDEARVVAVADIRKEAREEAGAIACNTIEEVLGWPGVEAVSICLPPVEHFPAVEKSLVAGKHVLCEKPLAANLSDARKVVAMAADRGLALCTAFCHRFHPTVRVTKKLLDDGSIGRIIMFRCQFASYFEGVERLWFSKKSIAGGGVILDNGCHAIDLFHYLVGPTRRVTALSGRFLPGLEVEDTAVILLESTQGAQGVVQLSWATPEATSGLEILGERGAIEMDYFNGPVRLKTPPGRQVREIQVAKEDRFAGETRNFVRGVLGKEAFILPDGLAVQEAISQVYQCVTDETSIPRVF